MTMTDMLATQDRTSAGDMIFQKCAVIEVHAGELKQLFDAIDPSPFRDRDLNLKAEEFIVGWAKDLPKEAFLYWWSTARQDCLMRPPSPER